MAVKPDKLKRLLQLLGPKALEADSLEELYAGITSSKNKEHAGKFAQTPYSARLVLLPQCLRATGKCKAVEHGSEYVCKRCRACKIAEIVERAEQLGYAGVKILKGGSAVARLIDELKPAAILGVACDFEGALGILECEQKGVAVQFVSLLKDGCADTDVNVSEVLAAMERAGG